MLPLVSGINSQLSSVNHTLISPILYHPVLPQTFTVTSGHIRFYFLVFSGLCFLVVVSDLRGEKIVAYIVQVVARIK